MIKVGIDEGATLLAGGLGKPKGMDKGWFVKPIFSDVSNDMRMLGRNIWSWSAIIPLKMKVTPLLSPMIHPTACHICRLVIQIVKNELRQA